MPNKRRNDESQAEFVASHFVKISDTNNFECQVCEVGAKRTFFCEKGIRVSYSSALTHLKKSHNLNFEEWLQSTQRQKRVEQGSLDAFTVRPQL